jgi:excisionase family DNA binding protein
MTNTTRRKRMATGQASRPTNSLLTPAEVAAAFRVDPKTVTRWAKSGKLASIRTLGGHRRYLESEVLAKLSDAEGLEEPRHWLTRSRGPFRAG